ncbi:MAG: HAD-IIIA family hydrolase [Proteobacteria bacterium]|nr:HAD-IIIA family hydrolase [Pseudomonadota bacterium]
MVIPGGARCRAVFVDRDGVINRAYVRDGKPFPPKTFSEFEILPGVREAFENLRRLGYLVIVATNQPDVADGTQSRDVVESMHREIEAVLRPDAIKVCWDRNANCYKPLPGLLLEAADSFQIDLSASWMVGDRWRDIGCGRAAGCRTIFIDRGYRESLIEQPDFVCTDLAAAAEIVAGQHQPA